jgi:hypothetical protein
VVDTARMMEQQWRLCIPHKLSYLARKFAIGNTHCLYGERHGESPIRNEGPACSPAQVLGGNVPEHSQSAEA